MGIKIDQGILENRIFTETLFHTLNIELSEIFDQSDKILDKEEKQKAKEGAKKKAYDLKVSIEKSLNPDIRKTYSQAREQYAKDGRSDKDYVPFSWDQWEVYHKQIGPLIKHLEEDTRKIIYDISYLVLQSITIQAQKDQLKNRPQDRFDMLRVDINTLFEVMSYEVELRSQDKSHHAETMQIMDDIESTLREDIVGVYKKNWSDGDIRYYDTSFIKDLQISKEQVLAWKSRIQPYLEKLPTGVRTDVETMTLTIMYATGRQGQFDGASGLKARRGPPLKPPWEQSPPMN